LRGLRSGGRACIIAVGDDARGSLKQALTARSR
jgi:hypothetical protein